MDHALLALIHHSFNQLQYSAITGDAIIGFVIINVRRTFVSITIAFITSAIKSACNQFVFFYNYCCNYAPQITSGFYNCLDSSNFVFGAETSKWLVSSNWLIDWLIDFNGVSTHLGLFYTQKLRNHLYSTFIFIFMCCFLIDILFCFCTRLCDIKYSYPIQIIYIWPPYQRGLEYVNCVPNWGIKNLQKRVRHLMGKL